MTADPKIQARTGELVKESTVTLQAIRNLAGETVQDPWIDPNVLAKSVNLGILDAPQLKNNTYARGKIFTRIIHGACVAVDAKGNLISESERLSTIE